MPSLGQRLRHLQRRLLDIRLGSGAVVLPKDVKRIHMRFGAHINGGHMGPRKFWRHELIRMKYHNPAIPMTVDQVRESQTADTEATMSIHFVESPDAKQTSDSAFSSPAPVDSTAEGTHPSEAAPTERVETIDMRNKTNSEILQQLVLLTKAKPVEPTQEEKEHLQALEEQKVRSESVRELHLEHKAKVKREKELFEQGRTDLVKN